MYHFASKPIQKQKNVQVSIEHTKDPFPVQVSQGNQFNDVPTK